MGVNHLDAAILFHNKHILRGKKILSFGNPFGCSQSFKKYLSRVDNDSLEEKPRNIQARFLFEGILGATCLHILDISRDEGPDIIADLNHEINTEKLHRYYDIIFDFGTQEHVFNGEQFLKNVFYLLSKGGLYFFDLPANNQLEHGFRQYSPTYFYDLCSTNCSSLKICHLSIRASGILLDTLPLYSKLDPNFPRVYQPRAIMPPKVVKSVGPFTGMSIKLSNKIRDEIGVLGVISLVEINTHDFSFDAVQCIYRKMSLHEILPQTSLFNLSKGSIFRYSSIALNILLLRLPPLIAISFFAFLHSLGSNLRRM
jgi:hypothetical protein